MLKQPFATTKAMGLRKMHSEFQKLIILLLVCSERTVNGFIRKIGRTMMVNKFVE